MSLEYVRKYYGVPAEPGRRVTVNGKPGIIVRDSGAYIGVNFDGTKPTDIRPCHPTWMVEYLEMGELPKLTRSQKRYLDYLDCSDCFESFKDYLRYLSQRKVNAA